MEKSADPLLHQIPAHYRLAMCLLGCHSLILAISIVLAAHNAHPGLRIQGVLGLTTLIAAIVGEAVSDFQLRQFEADPANRNSVCDIGLWRWSRHPNYFFE